jgi:excisionase family DNA binding protein
LTILSRVSIIDCMEKLYTIKETADLLRISKATLFRLMAEGKITPLKLGKRSLFTEEELTRFIETLKASSRRQ